jgi:hypothetical protein
MSQGNKDDVPSGLISKKLKAGERCAAVRLKKADETCRRRNDDSVASREKLGDIA